MSIFYYLAFGFLLFSCTAGGEDNSVSDYPVASDIETHTVELAKVTRKPFVARVLTNGKLLSVLEVPLAFQRQGLIDKISVRNGMQVKSGQLLAVLKNDQQQLELHEARLQLDESRVELNDQLITQGGKRGDTNSVSRDLFSYIKLRSGFNRALLSVRKAELELNKTFLVAPINGTIANLAASPHSPVISDKPFCTLLDRSKILVRCSILETELMAVSVGQAVKVEPIGQDRSYDGVVYEINPVVSPQGLIEATIQVSNPAPWLLPGMNAKVSIEKRFDKVLVISKRAVVDRSGRKVVFVYENSKAKWRYVKIGHENDNEVTILEGLNMGESVIVSGNLNLANDARVKLQ